MTSQPVSDQTVSESPVIIARNRLASIRTQANLLAEVELIQTCRQAFITRGRSLSFAQRALVPMGRTSSDVDKCVEAIKALLSARRAQIAEEFNEATNTPIDPDQPMKPVVQDRKTQELEEHARKIEAGNKMLAKLTGLDSQLFPEDTEQVVPIEATIEEKPKKKFTLKGAWSQLQDIVAPQIEEEAVPVVGLDEQEAILPASEVSSEWLSASKLSETGSDMDNLALIEEILAGNPESISQARAELELIKLNKPMIKGIFSRLKKQASLEISTSTMIKEVISEQADGWLAEIDAMDILLDETEEVERFFHPN